MRGTATTLTIETSTMKSGIHPVYPVTTITCACGNSVKTRSTRGDFSIDVCAACHPFYTGKQKIMDTAGRVDRFKKRFEKIGAPAVRAAK